MSLRATLALCLAGMSGLYFAWFHYFMELP